MKHIAGTNIRIFSGYPVWINEQPYRLAISGCTKELFQYLLINANKESRREYLAELFWRESTVKRQRSALNSAIWRIKRQITDVDGVELYCDCSDVVLRIASTVKIDAVELVDIVNSISSGTQLSEEIASRLFRLLDTSDVSFMDGITSNWVLTERERLFNVRMRGLTILMHWLGQERRYEDALDIGRRLLAADPARESALCEVMWLYVLSGQRAKAIHQYKEFHSWLKCELAIDPMPETKALYNFIRQELSAEKLGKVIQFSGAEVAEPQRVAFNRLLDRIECSRCDLYGVLKSKFP